MTATTSTTAITTTTITDLASNEFEEGRLACPVRSNESHSRVKVNAKLEVSVDQRLTNKFLPVEAE